MDRISNTEFWLGFEKQASTFGHVAEIGGLGLLAVPSIQHLLGKKVSDKAKNTMELAGLGMLAAPSVLSLMKGLK